MKFNPIVAVGLSALCMYPISDSDPISVGVVKPLYRVECLVPFKSQCYWPKSELRKALVDQDLHEMTAATLQQSPGMEGYRSFVPIVIERPYPPPATVKQRNALLDLTKLALVDSFIPEQVELNGRADADLFAEKFSHLYVNGELVDCCKSRRPRMGPLTYTGNSEFNLWGLSSKQSCYRHICPVEYSINERSGREENALLLTENFPLDRDETQIAEDGSEENGHPRMWSSEEERAMFDL